MYSRDPPWRRRLAISVYAANRAVMEPLLEYIEEVQRQDPNGYVTVILPELFPHQLWQHLLHNQHALLIKGALLFKRTWSSPACRFTSAAPRVTGRTLRPRPMPS